MLAVPFFVKRNIAERITIQMLTKQEMDPPYVSSAVNFDNFSSPKHTFQEEFQFHSLPGSPKKSLAASAIVSIVIAVTP